MTAFDNRAPLAAGAPEMDKPSACSTPNGEARIGVHLVADSGFEHLSQHRITLDQWAAINVILNGETVVQSETACRWIPVGERLPNPHTDHDFIVATRSGYVTALNFGENGWYSGHSNEEEANDGYWNGCVTHWQGMPEAPIENKATTL